MNKVDETIEVLCDWIQAQLVDDKCDISHQVSEMTKALAALITAKANLNMSVRMHEGKRINQNHQK